MVTIVTGVIGVGKTTFCEKVIKIAQNQGYDCGGIITRKTQNEDIIIEDVQTGQTEILASTSEPGFPISNWVHRHLSMVK